MCARRRPCGPDYFDSLGPHPRLTRPSVPVYNTGEDFPRPHRLTTPRPIHLSTRRADSPMIDFSFTMVIIDSTVDIFWPNISGIIISLSYWITHAGLHHG